MWRVWGIALLACSAGCSTPKEKEECPEEMAFGLDDEEVEWTSGEVADASQEEIVDDAEGI